MTTTNTQGSIIPGSAVDISNSQYILNWIASGGNQENSDASGNNIVASKIKSDISYNIKDNQISFFFEEKLHNNITNRDAQYIINWNYASGDSSHNKIFGNTDRQYSVNDYSYPISKDFICLVTHENITINENVICKNRLYLKQKNTSVADTDISLNKYILANSIPYLKLDASAGFILKRVDTILDNSATVQIYKSGYDNSNNIIQESILSISSENLSNIYINRNTNNIFPPSQEFSTQLYKTSGFHPAFVDIVQHPLTQLVYEDSGIDLLTLDDLIDEVTKYPWYSDNPDDSNIAELYSNHTANENFIYIYHYDTVQGFRALRWGLTVWINTGWHPGSHKPVNLAGHNGRFAYPIISDSILNIYSYVGIDKTVPYKNNVNYTTSYHNVYNQNVEIPNWGVQSVDISSELTNRLTTVDTIFTNTNNMLNINNLITNPIDFNKVSWFLADSPVNSTQGHLVGQFVFTKEAAGTMIYQYFYSTDNSDTLSMPNSPYSLYFDISQGELTLQGNFPNINITWYSSIDSKPQILSIESSTTLHNEKIYLTHILADIYKEEGLRFCYAIERIDTVNWLFYSEWKNFKITDLSVNENDPNADGRWGLLPSSNSENPEFKNTLQHINNSLLINPPDLSGTLYLTNTFNNNYTCYNHDSHITSHNIHNDCIVGGFVTIIMGRNNIFFPYSTSTSTFNLTVIPNVLPDNAFRYYCDLENIIFNKTLTTIGVTIFNGLYKLKHITIPETVQTIDFQAFADCPGLQTITFLGDKIANFPTPNSFNNSTNLSTIFFITGKSGWSIDRYIHPGDITTNIVRVLPLPYNGNIFQQQFTITELQNESFNFYYNIIGAYRDIHVGELQSNQRIRINIDNVYSTIQWSILFIYNDHTSDEIIIRNSDVDNTQGINVNFPNTYSEHLGETYDEAVETNNDHSNHFDSRNGYNKSYTVKRKSPNGWQDSAEATGLTQNRWSFEANSSGLYKLYFDMYNDLNNPNLPWVLYGITIEIIQV